jgi:hypothetical protein
LLAPPHWEFAKISLITFTARCSTWGGIVTPIWFAVLRLIDKSKFGVLRNQNAERPDICGLLSFRHAHTPPEEDED